MKKVRLSKGEWLILLVVALAFFMRLWPVGYVFYGGHSAEISDAAYKFIHEGRILLYGYTNLNYYGQYGPAPYYLFTLFALFSTSPFSVVFCTILLGTVTTYVLYRIGRDFWNRSVGLIVALLWAASHFSVVTSRQPHSGNIAPLFISLFFYALLALVRGKSARYYVLLFFSLGMILQIHVTAFPVLLLVIPALFLGMPRSWKWILVGCCILVILFGPYLYAEVNNRFAETLKVLDGFSALRGAEKTTTFLSDSAQYLFSYANPFERYPDTNPFLQNIKNRENYFCKDLSQYSRFAGFMGRALRTTSTIAWLLFLPLPLIFCFWLVRQRKKLGSIEFNGSVLLLIWFFSSVLLQSLLPWHQPYYLHSLFISTILLWAVGWGWLLPSLAGRYKQATRLFALLFVLTLVIVNGVGWTAFHITNPQKGCIGTTPSLSALEDIAEVLAVDRRVIERAGEPPVEKTLIDILSTYKANVYDQMHGLPFVVREAVRRRKLEGGQFANLSGRYVLISEQSLPFRLPPEVSQKKIGSYVLFRQSPLLNASSLAIAKVGDTKDIESARRIARGQLESWHRSEVWPPITNRRCLVECPRANLEDLDCQRCLGNSTVYLRAFLDRNHTARTALIVNEILGAELRNIGAIYLNDEPLFRDGEVLVAGERLWEQEILMDVTGRLNWDANILEILFFHKTVELGPNPTNRIRPDIFTIQGS